MCTSENNLYFCKRFTARTLIDPSRDNTKYRVRLLVTDLDLAKIGYVTTHAPLHVSNSDGPIMLWYCNTPADMAIRITGILLPKGGTPDIIHALTWYPCYSQAEAEIIAQRILDSLGCWDKVQDK